MKLNEETGLYENYGIWHTPFWQTTLFYMIIGGMFLCVIIFLIWFVIKRYRVHKRQQLIPAWTAALQELRDLENRNVLRVVSGKVFYLAVTSILKRYLEKRYGYDLRGKTDDEVVDYLKNNKVKLALIQDVESILGGAVIIKFANAQAAQEQIHSDFERSVLLVKRTIPKEQ